MLKIECVCLTHSGNRRWMSQYLGHREPRQIRQRIRAATGSRGIRAKSDVADEIHIRCDAQQIMLPTGIQPQKIPAAILA
tara:strand:+ start:527 stop:766 length:240 start_codon:yes stop_codon:yes gene_type:complete